MITQLAKSNCVSIDRNVAPGNLLVNEQKMGVVPDRYKINFKEPKYSIISNKFNKQTTDLISK